ncbi:MAG TPA: MFS transporter [Steroidobacteraceae bacterium]|nr:MFS transporter [Steroidobacteraceae bacterium]
MDQRATRIQLFSLSTTPMRVFHLSWLAFFVCFFAWFAVAPLMPIIRGDLGLTKDQIANINIAAVAVTILVRLIIGPLCDRYGPRRTYTWLLALGAIPVMAIAFSHSYMSFLFLRLCIGAVGASFVVTQIHTSIMFAPNVVGTANAATAGWGNSGGGATQALMPLIVTAIAYFGVEQSMGWRIAMFVPGVMMLIMAVLYCKYAKDTPGEAVNHHIASAKGWESFKLAAGNYRVWMLFCTYAACFGVELTIHNIASVYYVDHYGLDIKTAGLYAGSFGLLALFARALGGITSDWIARNKGLDGRTTWLFALILIEGIGLSWFAKAGDAHSAFIAMLLFGLFTHMACGATYSLTPFINSRAKGGVAGIIGAGGNVGAVLAGFLMKGTASTQQGLAIMGTLVMIISVCAIAIRFSHAHKTVERREYAAALIAREQQEAALAPSSVASEVA